MNKELILKLSPEKVQLILNVLAERPFKEVADIIPDIMQQAQNQPQPAQPTGD